MTLTSADDATESTLATDEPVAAPPARPRLVSLDAFRGLTIAGMILVNNPGTWEHVHPPLRHAEWDGWTPTDLVFPFFLFIVGVAIPLAFSARRARGAGVFGLLLKILWRSLVIFGIGLAMNGFPEYQLDAIRIPGVLQRIAVCYLFASVLSLLFGPRGLAALVVLLLGGYTAAMLLVPVPGGAAGDLSRAGNLAAYVDTTLLAGHTYKADYDPEGLLSTLPALATTLIGVLAGLWIQAAPTRAEASAGLLAPGVLLALLGYVTSAGVPINKALWSAPFVLLTAGLALLGLGAMFWLIDVRGIRRWAAPLVVFGVNPIAAYVLSGFGARLLTMVRVPDGDGTATLKGWLMAHVFDRLAEPLNASLLFALSYVLLWWLVMALFARYRIIIKV